MFEIPFFVSLTAMTAGLFDMPYGYYIILRLAVFATAIYGLTLVFKSNGLLAVAMVAIAITYNPLFPIQLGSKGAWVAFNLGTLGLFLESLERINAVNKMSNFAFEADVVRQRTVSCGLRVPRGSTRR